MKKRNNEERESVNSTAMVKEQKEKAFSGIGIKSFLLVVGILVGVIAVSGILTLLIPQGKYLRDKEGMIIAGSFIQGKVEGIEFWRIISAPIRVFVSSDALTIIMISIFLLVMSGVFNLLDKTGGLKIVIGRVVKKFENRKMLIIVIAVFIFMLFGSFFGMFEELVALLPLVTVLMLSLKFDTLTGLGVCMLASCFGFSAAITNPFSVGMVASIAGVGVLDGVWLRIVFFAMVFVSVSVFLILHTRRIAKNPSSSLTFEIDREKLSKMNFEQHKENEGDARTFKIFCIFFAVQMVLLVAIASIRAISGFAIPILAVSFLIGGIVCGILVCEKKGKVASYMIKGAVAMLPAVVMIALASSVKLIMEEGGILDTVMHSVITSLEGQSKFLCVVLVYLLVLFLQIFIGSSSAKIMLIMPIILPVANSLGISTTVIILTYCMADGFTDVFLPTNPVLLAGLSMANVSYGKWVKWTWKFQIIMFALTILVLLFAVQISY